MAIIDVSKPKHNNNNNNNNKKGRVERQRKFIVTLPI